MLGEDRRPGLFWRICWKFISPLILLVRWCSIEVIHAYLIVLCLAADYSLLVTVLSRRNTGRLYLSIVGTCSRLASRHCLPWLASIHVSCRNLSSRDVGCMFRIRSQPTKSLFSSRLNRSSDKLDYPTWDGVPPSKSIVDSLRVTRAAFLQTDSASRLSQSSIQQTRPPGIHAAEQDPNLKWQSSEKTARGFKLYLSGWRKNTRKKTYCYEQEKRKKKKSISVPAKSRDWPD